MPIHTEPGRTLLKPFDRRRFLAAAGLAGLASRSRPRRKDHTLLVGDQRDGSVDGRAIWDPNAALAVRHGGARVVVGGDGLVPTYTLLFASDAALATKRALLADYHDRLYRGWAWAADHIDAYAALVARETGLDAALWRDVLTRWHSLPVPVDARLITDQQATADRYHRAGLIDRQIDVTPAFNTTFAA